MGRRDRYSPDGINRLMGTVLPFAPREALTTRSRPWPRATKRVSRNTGGHRTDQWSGPLAPDRITDLFLHPCRAPEGRPMAKHRTYSPDFDLDREVPNRRPRRGCGRGRSAAELRSPDCRARTTGRQAALELEFVKGTSRAAPRPKSHHVRHHRPSGVSIAQRCRLMATARSTIYAEPSPADDDTAVV